MAERYDAAKIARDLGECRQRGLDWLDRRTTNQSPVKAVDLQQLAADYAAAKRLVEVGRIDQIKTLLRHGIEQFALQGHATEAALVRELFFGQSVDGPIRPPGDLLKAARVRSGDTEARFRERRMTVMRSFSQFLAALVSAPIDEGEIRHEDSPGSYAQQVIIGYVEDNGRFIQMLADATKVTIIGITNENLKPMLQEAIRRKRANGRPDAFWDSLRIVFLENSLLESVNDHRGELNDQEEAFRQRREESFYAHKSVGTFLRRTHPSRWELFKSPYMPMITGTLFEFADRKKIVHIMIRRSRRPDAENLYMDMEDHAERFSVVFEDIVRYSKSNYNVPVGVPVGGKFEWNRLRLYSKVLKDGSGESGWLPMILAVTYRRQGDRLQPIVQLRTEDNSGRELRRLSHLSGHISQEDCEKSIPLDGHISRSFDLQSETPRRAARRLIQDVIGLEEANLEPQTTGSYLYPNMEHLFFFVFSLEFTEGTPFPRRAEMRPVSVNELAAIRANQVLRSAAQLCELDGDLGGTWMTAAEVLAPNLILHDHADLADRLTNMSGRSFADRAEVAALIRGQVSYNAVPRWASAEHAEPLVGIAGWQYREFFSVLLPIYSKIGISGAAELLKHIDDDPHRSAARDTLMVLYQDEHLLGPQSIEL